MSDARLREVERRWKETGSPDDEAAYLLERVRVGDLTRERLELAAYCGHEAARRAAPDRRAHGSKPGDSSATMLAWLRRLEEQYGLVRTIDLACLIGRAVLRTVRGLSPADVEALTYELEGMEAWVDCPCEEHIEQLIARSQLGGVHPLANVFGAIIYPASSKTAPMCEGQSAADLLGRALDRCLTLPGGARRALPEALEAMARRSLSTTRRDE